LIAKRGEIADTLGSFAGLKNREHSLAIFITRLNDANCVDVTYTGKRISGQIIPAVGSSHRQSFMFSWHGGDQPGNCQEGNEWRAEVDHFGW
jgi:hypothetical protein